MRNKFFSYGMILFLMLFIIACGGGGDSAPATYNISGAVSGATLAGVTINLTGAATASATTDASGNFSFTGRANGSYTVTPSKAGYTFNPVSSVVVVSGASVTNTNFVAATGALTYSISGTVAGAVLSGVTITLSGANTGSVATGVGGIYTISDLVPGSYTVTPSLTGFTFSPTSSAVTITAADSTGNNFVATAIPVAHSISGTVSGATLSGVTITVTGTATATATTAADGSYTVTGLYDGNYTVTPSKTSFTFTPSSSAVTMSGANVTGKNFTAAVYVPPTHSISGVVSGAVLSGVTITLSGDGSATTTTNTSGNYSFSGIANGNYTVTPSLTGYTFSPASSAVNVSGANITGTNFVATAKAQSAVDGFNPGANAEVNAVAVQADGKVLVGGAFTRLGGGGTGTTTRNYIGRINVDGSLDTGFNPGANGAVYALAVQANGKILVGGNFTGLGGSPSTGWTPRNYIGRLNADGSLDTSFNPGADGTVFALVVQADGNILVGGDSFIARLSANGSWYGGFDRGPNSKVWTVAVQADGKILFGGDFSYLNHWLTPSNCLDRLNADGSLDPSFAGGGANNRVSALAVQADGKILVGGDFTMLGFGGGLIGWAARNYIGRLNANGSLDTNFNPGANGYSVDALVVQQDGKILVGGFFYGLGGGTGTTTRNHLGRLNADGSVDTSFNPGANSAVNAFAVQADGKILVVGAFTSLGGGGTGTTTRNYIGRITFQ